MGEAVGACVGEGEGVGYKFELELDEQPASMSDDPIKLINKKRNINITP